MSNIRLAATAALVALAVACTPESTGPGDPPLPPGEFSNWSDPRSWPDRSLPVAGQAVVIPEGQKITLDVSPPALASLTVEGELRFGDRDVELTAGWIMVHGSFSIGTEAQPHSRKAVITLTGPGSDDIMGLGARVFGVMGERARLELHGRKRLTWTRLQGTAPAGATQLTLAEPVDWSPGDRVVVASSDLNPFWVDEGIVASAQGNTVTLESPLRYSHWGQTEQFDGRTVDQRAEVGLLTRNIVIQGDPATVPAGLGGHVLVTGGAEARVEGVEFYLMGQRSQLARYPMHWHVMGQVQNQYFRDNAVWKSQNRCLTIHGTDGVRAERNVCYDHIGHGYFLEDGAESGNHLERNLGVLTRRAVTGQEVLPTDLGPATFWITNPDNHYIGNVAAGSQGHGFWFALPNRPTGLSTGQPDYPRTTPLGSFTGNVAHSNLKDGLHVDAGPKPDGTTETASYRPRQVPAASSPAVTAVFRNFTAWKNSNRGAWLRGTELRMSGAVFSDNKIGATFAANETFVEDALFVGQTSNSGGTGYPAGFPVRGYEFYDGRVGARRVSFVNYVPAGGRTFSAIGFNRNNSFPLSPGNYVESAKFVNANRVFVENPKPERDGDKAAMFLDLDGSVTGTAGHFVAANNPLMVTGACALRTEWNAWDCADRRLRLQVRGINGEVIGPAVIQRADGPSATYVGTGNDPVNVSASLPAGRHYTLQPGATLPLSPRFFVTGLAAGDWLRVSLPYPSATVRVYRDYSTTVTLAPAASLAELDASSGDRYFLQGGTLHLKFAPQSGRDYSVLYVTP